MRRLPDTRDDLLEAIHQHGSPIGSRAAAAILRSRGREISESTVSRMLADLDDAGLTRSSGRKGRLLTEQGRRAVADRRLEVQQGSSMAAALAITDVEALVDQLTCRRGIEREAARAAALRADSADLGQLSEVMSQSASGAFHERVAFHRHVAKISHNRQIQAIANTLFHERLAQLERLLFLIGFKQNTLGQWSDHHREITAAITAGDPDGAERTMARHLDCMIEQTEQFAGDNPHLLDSLLAEAIVS